MRSIFTRIEFVKEVEKNLHRVETESPQEVLESLIAPAETYYAHLNAEAAAQLAGYIEKRMGSKELKRQERRLKNLARRTPSRDSGDFETFSRQFASRKIDFSLFALYHGIKRESLNKS